MYLDDNLKALIKKIDEAIKNDFSENKKIRNVLAEFNKLGYKTKYRVNILIIVDESPKLSLTFKDIHFLKSLKISTKDLK